MKKENSSFVDFLELKRRLEIKFGSYITKALEKHNISMQHYTILLILMNEENLKMVDIAKQIGITNPAVTNLVDILEKKKMIKRIACDYDRRVKLIEISKKGCMCVESIQGQIIEVLEKTFSTFSKKGQENINIFYRKFIENLNKELLNDQN